MHVLFLYLLSSTSTIIRYIYMRWNAVSIRIEHEGASGYSKTTLVKRATRGFRFVWEKAAWRPAVSPDTL